jgi:hypothetical protein
MNPRHGIWGIFLLSQIILVRYLLGLGLECNLTTGARTMELKTDYLDNKAVAYSNETEFLVQLGKGKGSYKTRWHFKGSLPLAVWYYNALNVGYGYKKRLLMPSSKKPVLAVKRT